MGVQVSGRGVSEGVYEAVRCARREASHSPILSLTPIAHLNIPATIIVGEIPRETKETTIGEIRRGSGSLQKCPRVFQAGLLSHPPVNLGR